VELETLYELPSPSDDALLKECEDRIQERRQHELSRHTWELDAMERNQPLPTAQRNILSGLERKSEQCARSQGDRTVRAASDGILARNFPKDENSSRATQGTSEEAVPKRTLRQFHTLRWPRSRSMHARQDKETLAQRSSSTVTSSSTICPDESASQIIPLANVGSAPAFLANTNPETHGRNVTLDNPSTHFHCLTCPWPTCDIRLEDLGITVLSHLNGHIERIRETRKPDDYSCPWPECPEPFIFKDDHVSAYHILPLACRSTQTSRPGRVSSHNDLQDQSPAYIRLWERAHLLDRDIDQLQRRIFERRRRCHMSAKCNHSKLKPWAERDNAVQICEWEDELAHVRVALTRQTRAPAAPVNMSGKHRAKLNSDHASCTKLAEMVADLELQQEKRGVADRDENCSIALRALTSDRTGPGNEKAHARQGNQYKSTG
jgi:hypothetical protein